MQIRITSNVRQTIAHGLNTREVATRLKIRKTALYAALQVAGSSSAADS